VLIVGDYTARVGDPSGRSSTRPVLDADEIDAHARAFQEQAVKVLDTERLEVRFNGEWLDMPMASLFTLLRTTTVAQVLERDDFSKRMRAHEPVSMLELLYPLLQGYDSVAVEADVELGGADQKFNLLLGRDIQRAYGVPEQVILTVPLLTGTDGERKMSKSFDNYVGVSDSPEEMYGKTLSIPDSSLASWYSLLLGSEPPAGQSPRDAKRALARDLVTRFHDAAAASEAERAFDRVHVDHELPEDVPVVGWDGERSEVHLPALLAHAFSISTSEARRALAQGGVRLDGETVADGALDVPAAEVDGRVLQLGKRRFARVKIA
jgi:tyrosyl-tRNA synthetase